MRLRPSDRCRRCGFWLEGEWSRLATAYLGAELKRYRVALAEQVAAGECWGCQGARLRAAEDFIRVADQARVLKMLGRPIPRSLTEAIGAADHNLTAAGLPPLKLPRTARGETERCT